MTLIQMIKLKQQTALGTCNIFIKEGLFQESGKIIEKSFPKSQVAIITESRVKKLFKKELKQAFPNALILTVPRGEKTKNIQTVMKLAKKLMDKNFARNDVIIGFGGGMVTDLAGFLASIYMRGIAYVSIPTSLLCMADASIGGKTGVNFWSKNSIGSFYPAKYILSDPGFLKGFKKLTDMSGWGEIIKYSAIIDASLEKDLNKKNIDLETILKKAAKAKVKVTSGDLKEAGKRKWLNFGHTFGHAIEWASHYKYSHDEAISIGMVIANRIAQKLGIQKKSVGNKIERTLKKFDLPTKLPRGMKIKDLVKLIEKDKKRIGNKIDFILVTEMGKAVIMPFTPEELLELAS